MSSFLVIKKNLELSAGTGARMLVGKQNRAIPAPPSPLLYDSEIEYIESTGTQWIDTEVDCGSLNFSLEYKTDYKGIFWGWVH